MPPRKAPSVPIDALTTLHAEMQAKSASYTSTASAYRSKCDNGKKVQLLTNARVVDMLAGWVKRIIDEHSPEVVSHAPDQAREPRSAIAAESAGVGEVAVDTSAPHRTLAADEESPNQGEGYVDVRGLRTDHD